MACALFAFDTDFFVALAFIVVITLIQLFHRQILAFLSKSINKIVSVGPVVFGEFIFGFKLRPIPLKTVFYSIGLVLVIDLFYILAVPNVSFPPLQFTAFSTVFLHPAVEEFVFRGLVFGLLLMILNSFRKLHVSVLIQVPTFFILSFFQAVIFAQYHDSLIILVQGLLFGLLFIGHKRFGSQNNLLPPIIAHAVHNLFIVVMTWVV